MTSTRLEYVGEPHESFYYTMRFLENAVNLKASEILFVGKDEKFKWFFDKSEIPTLDINSKISPTIVGDIEKTNIKDGGYKVIICFNVLEHTKHPIEAVKEMKRILNDEGVILISVPKAAEEHRKPDYWRFTKDSFVLLVEENNMKLIDYEEYGFITYMRGAIKK